MPLSNTPAPSLTPQISTPGKNKLTKLQQQFNQKTEQIEKLKQEIAAKRESISTAQRRIEKELRPIIDQQLEKRIALVELLDEAYSMPFFSRWEVEKLAALIEDITYTLIERYERRDMILIHDRYAELSFEEKITQAKELIGDFDEDAPGDVFEEPALVNPDDFEAIQAQLDKEEQQREQEKQSRQKNRKTKAQLAKEAQAKAELNNISKASRRVYTDLAKQLHPDKELDETARAWKEEAMKKVTQAYHHDDFFELLRLQMEFLQEQGQGLNALPDEQLQYYIKILSDQIDELKEEMQEFAYNPGSDFYNRFCGTPKQMGRKFKRAKEDLNLELDHLKQNLRALQNDPQLIRMMLKEVG